MTERDVTATYALRHVAALGSHLTVAVREHRPAGGGWRPVAGLYDPAAGALGDLLDSTAARLGTRDRRVAASILHQGYAARLWSVTLGCVAAYDLVPTLGAADTYWRSTEQSLVELLTVAPAATTVAGEELDGTARLVAGIALDTHVDPLAAAVRAATGVARKILVGNTVSALVGTLRVLAPHGLGGIATDVARVLFDTGTLGAGGTVDLAAYPPVLRRDSCCLFYRCLAAACAVTACCGADWDRTPFPCRMARADRRGEVNGTWSSSGGHCLASGCSTCTRRGMGAGWA